MLQKINIFNIIIKHFKTFHKANPKKVSLGEIFWYLFIPLIFSLVLYFIDIKLSAEIAAVAISAFAIFGGLLFGLPINLVNLYDRIYKESPELAKEKNKRDKALMLVKETYCNVSFCIVLSILSIVLTVVTRLSPSAFGNGVCFYFYSLSVLSIFIVIKRIHSLFSYSLPKNNINR